MTYVLERIAMYILGIDNVMDLPFNNPNSLYPKKYGDVFYKSEREYSHLEF